MHCAAVAGITINQYQVDRANHHNARLGVAPLADVVRGNFCELPFPPDTFDAAYAIEATCHGEGGAVSKAAGLGAWPLHRVLCGVCCIAVKMLSVMYKKLCTGTMLRH